MAAGIQYLAEDFSGFSDVEQTDDDTSVLSTEGLHSVCRISIEALPLNAYTFTPSELLESRFRSQNYDILEYEIRI